jgi:hypothetical protein
MRNARHRRVAQRFFETESREEIVEEVEAAEQDVLRELRAITARLHELEVSVERLHR